MRIAKTVVASALLVLSSFCMQHVEGFVSIARTKTFAPPLKMQDVVNTPTTPAVLDFDGIAGRMKLISYGQRPKQTFGLESRDRSTYIEAKTVEVNRTGGIGLLLIEVENNAIDRSGLVLIEGITPGSNADNAAGFMVGDALMSVDTPDGKSYPLLGLSYDRVIDVLSGLDEFDTIKITVQRMSFRGEVKVEVVGPGGEPVGEYTILSGYGTNLRTVLDAANLKIYDARTSRFDSPYETGNCGGEGTCGTCMVAVLEGQQLTNSRVAVEEGALKQQMCPPNYRWSCRTQVGARPATNGKLKIKLRPQTAAWDAANQQ